MPLHLTDGELRRIRKLQDLLVAPLRFRTSERWIDSIHRAIRALFGVERSLVVLPRTDGRVRVHSDTIEPGIMKGMKRAMLGTSKGVNRYDDPKLDLAMRRLAAAGVEVWTRESAERTSRISLVDMPRFYPEVVRPGRLEGMLMMGASLVEGRGMLGVFPGRPADTEFSVRSSAVLRLLLPAFKAGGRARLLSDRRWRRFAGSFDLLDDGVAVYTGGVERYRNRALRRLLEAEDEREKLLAGIEACARELERILGRSKATAGPWDLSREVQTVANGYRLASSHLEGGDDGRPVTVVVTVHPTVPPLPSEGELRERYRLTARQAEVALLLARGRSNREIGERLGISPHTARHHAQRVLEKVGAESRKALALHLLGDRRT